MTVAFAGMTVAYAGMTVAYAGMTVAYAGMTVSVRYLGNHLIEDISGSDSFFKNFSHVAGESAC